VLYLPNFAADLANQNVAKYRDSELSMSYIINRYNGSYLATVADGTVNTTTTDLAFVGRAVTDYGIYENENYLYLLENFANSTAPLQPILGQLWYNSTTDTISTYTNANTWVALASQGYVQDYAQAQKVSPAFTGVPTAPTASLGVNTTQIATTAFVNNSISNFSGSINDAKLLGNSTAITASLGTSTTQIATTAFVINQLGGANSITCVGNITGGNLLTAGSVSAGGTIRSGSDFIGTGLVTTGRISATGDITGSNFVTGGSITAVGVIGTSGSVSAVGNVIGANFIGNVTIPAGSPVSTTGNVVGGNIYTGGIVSATGNITGGNIRSSGVVSTTGNVVGGNILSIGAVSTAGNITGNNITGSNLLSTGVVSAAGNIVTTNTVIADVVIANTVITNGTTSAFRLPNLTQSQINALSANNGDMVYNTTVNLSQVYQNGSWNNFTVSYYS